MHERFDPTETNEYGDTWWALRHVGPSWAGNTRWMTFETLNAVSRRVILLNREPGRIAGLKILLRLGIHDDFIKKDCVLLYSGRSRQKMLW